MKRQSVFSTKMGKRLTEVLVSHIARTEPFQNWDECLDEIRESLCRLGDKGYGLPVSTFIRAEEMNRLKKRVDCSRYAISIQEGI